MPDRSPTNIEKARLNAIARLAVNEDESDLSVCAIGERQYSTVFGVIPDTLAILRAAAAFESDRTKLVEWFLGDRIASLGGLSAASLVSTGRATQVLDFLKDVELAEQGKSAEKMSKAENASNCIDIFQRISHKSDLPNSLCGNPVLEAFGEFGRTRANLAASLPAEFSDRR